MHPRYSTRKRVTCAVTLSCDGLVGQGQVLDLSVPGCLLETGLPLKHGQFLQLRLTLSNGQPPVRMALAVIRWLNGTKAGVEFIRMSEDDQMRLRSSVRFVHRPPISSRSWSEKVMWTGISGI